MTGPGARPPRGTRSSAAVPRTRRGRATRSALVDAARERFRAEGYINVSVPSIAAACQRSPATFYTYFDSKAHLLQTLAEEAIAGFRERLRRDLAQDGPSDRLVHRVVRTMWATYRDELPIFLSAFQIATRDLELEPWRSLRELLTDTISEIHHRVESSLGMAPVGPRRCVARALASMIEMFCFVWIGQGGDDPDGGIDDDKAISTLTGIWLATLGGWPETSAISPSSSVRGLR